MTNRIAAAIFAAAALVLAAKADTARYTAVEPVPIDGYAGEAMEPFVSRDGRYLFFNSRNTPGTNTNIHFAVASGEGFVYRGVLEGTVSYALDAVPALAPNGVFCFVSPREFRRTHVSVLCGIFDGDTVTRTTPQAGLATDALGHLIFDVDLASDGKTMIFAEGTYTGSDVPKAADLHFAALTPHGFQRTPDDDRLLANINTSALEYAPALSDDGLELFFTRVTGIWPFAGPRIMRATRKSTDEPFAKPEPLKIDGFVEAPSIAPDGTLYFHKRVANRYQIWRQAR